MSGKTALLSAAAAVALALLGGCKDYEERGSAQQVGRGAAAVETGDPAFRNSSGIHGDQNTLAGRSGVSSASGRRGG